MVLLPISFRIKIVRRFDKSIDVAAVKAASSEAVGEYFVLAGELHQGVGDLDFAPFAWRGVFENVENVGGEDVATDDGEVAGGFGGVGFFDQTGYV